MKVEKFHIGNRVYVFISEASAPAALSFASEKEMRRAGQCLIDLARIGGNVVEIKEKEK